MEKLKDPALVGVPETRPVEEPSVRPSGRAPEATVYVYPFPLPPEAEVLFEYVVPTDPPVSAPEAGDSVTRPSISRLAEAVRLEGPTGRETESVSEAPAVSTLMLLKVAPVPATVLTGPSPAATPDPVKVRVMGMPPVFCPFS